MADITRLPEGLFLDGTGKTVTADSTVTNTTTETALATLTVPTAAFVVGKCITIKLFGLVAVAATPTLRIRVREETIGGTAILDTAAITAASGDVFYGECNLTVRSIGATGAIEGYSTSGIDAPASATVNVVTEVDGVAVDTTTDTDFLITAEWSAASTANVATLQYASLLAW